METVEHDGVHDALVAVTRDVLAVAKSERNPQQGFSFRGIDAVMNAVGPAFRKHGVICTPTVRSVEYAAAQTAKGSTMNVARVQVTYTFRGPGSEVVEATVPGEAFDSGDKSTAKAMSVAYRTALLQVLTLPTDEPEPDAEAVDASVVVQEWSARIDSAGSADELREIYRQASSAGAPGVVADLIRERLKEFRGAEG